MKISLYKFFNKSSLKTITNNLEESSKNLVVVDSSLKDYIKLKTIETDKLNKKTKESKIKKREKKLELSDKFLGASSKLVNNFPRLGIIDFARKYLVFLAAGWIINSLTGFFSQNSGPIGFIMSSLSSIGELISDIFVKALDSFASFVNLGYQVWDTITGKGDSEKLQEAFDDVLGTLDDLIYGFMGSFTPKPKTPTPTPSPTTPKAPTTKPPTTPSTPTTPKVPTPKFKPGDLFKNLRRGFVTSIISSVVESWIAKNLIEVPFQNYRISQYFEKDEKSRSKHIKYLLKKIKSEREYQKTPRHSFDKLIALGGSTPSEKNLNTAKSDLARIVKESVDRKIPVDVSQFELDEVFKEEIKNQNKNKKKPQQQAQSKPKTPLVPKSKSPTGGYRELLDLIGKGEGGYNSMNQGTIGDRIVGSTPNAKSKIGKNLTEMTIGEIMNRQSYLMNPKNPQISNYGIYAAGKYQIIPGTMPTAVSEAKLSKDDLFSPENQEKLGMGLITGKRPYVGQYLRGEHNDLKGAMMELSLEFASIPNPNTGNSNYGSGNRALHTVKEVERVLKNSRKSISGKKGGGHIPKQSKKQNLQSLNKYPSYSTEGGMIMAIQPIIVEKPVPIPMNQNEGGITILPGRVNNNNSISLARG